MELDEKMDTTDNQADVMLVDSDNECTTNVNKSLARSECMNHLQ